MKRLTLVLDQGTSSTKVFLFDLSNTVVFKSIIKHPLRKLSPSQVEADSSQILNACQTLIHLACKKALEHNGRIISAGMAFQRSTFLFWDKKSLKPLTPALSWQDGRAADIIEIFKDDADTIFKITGGPLNPHFGGPKFTHLVTHNSNLARKVKNGEIYFGTISTFLTHCLTRNPYVDQSIASRFSLMNLKMASWDKNLLDLFDVRENVLPLIVPTVHPFGFIKFRKSRIPLRVVIGDQQAALIGQGGYRENAIGMNFGTSGSVQINSGKIPIHLIGLISSVLFSDQHHKQFLLEGTINACNSIFYHLENKLNIPHKDMLWHDRCSSTNTKRVYIPEFGGLASPYWIDNFKTPIKRSGFKSDNEMIRAAMESIGLLTFDILEIARKHMGTLPKQLFASGGGGRPPLLQFISDLTNISILQLRMKDSTALGVHSLLIKDYNGNWPGLNLSEGVYFKAEMNESSRLEKINKWHETLRESGIIN